MPADPCPLPEEYRQNFVRRYDVLKRYRGEIPYGVKPFVKPEEDGSRPVADLTARFILSPADTRQLVFEYRTGTKTSSKDKVRVAAMLRRIERNGSEKEERIDAEILSTLERTLLKETVLALVERTHGHMRPSPYESVTEP